MHLDKQLVQEGQLVKKGDVVGTVGNTGNARTTPAHLHFGVYTSSGPIDPYPFIDKTVKKAPAVPEKSMANYLRLTKSQKVNNQTIAANAVLVPLAVTPRGYISESPEGQILLTPFTAVQSTGQPVKGVSEATAVNDQDRKARRSDRG